MAEASAMGGGEGELTHRQVSRISDLHESPYLFPSDIAGVIGVALEEAERLLEALVESGCLRSKSRDGWRIYWPAEQCGGCST